MKINEKKNTIEITKTFAQKATRVGSPEYYELLKVRQENPSCTVEVKQTKSKDSFKGLTYDFMENYIKNHDDAEQSIMAEYLDLRGLSEEAKVNLMDPYTYGDMKKWFLNKFPAIAEFHKQCDELVAA